MYEESTVTRERNWRAILLRIALIIIILTLLWLLLPINPRNRQLSETFQSNMTELRNVGRDHFENNDLPTQQNSTIRVTLGDLIRTGEIMELFAENGNLCDEIESFIEARRTATDYELEITLVCGRERDSETIWLANVEPPSNNQTTTTTTTTTRTTTTATTPRPTTTTRRTTTRPPSTTQAPPTTTTATTQQRFMVVFNSNGGSLVANQQIISGNRATRPANPTRPGFRFDGWRLTTHQEFNFNTPITSNIILMARWVPVSSQSSSQPTSNQIFNVRFDATNSTPVILKQVRSGNTVSRPANPTRAGFRFDGWYHNSMPFNFNTPIRTNLTLSARWTSID